MGKFALGLAFFVAGLDFLRWKLGDLIRADQAMLVVMALYLPAVLLGSTRWWTVRSFARSRMVVLCVAIAWVGLLYGVDRENHRGLVNISYLTSVLPVAALIVENRCWWFCAKILVRATALAMGLTMWFQYQAHGMAMFRSLHRFGTLLSDDKTLRLVNPNLVGGQLAFAAILAFILYLRPETQACRARNPAVRPGHLSLGWTVFLSLGCILTASRGAFAAWLGGMGVLLFWGTTAQRSSRLRDLVAVSSVLLSILLFTTVATDFRPWQMLQTRLDNLTSASTASGRTLIWNDAFEIWSSSPQYMLVGTGTGAAPEALGRYRGLTDRRDPSLPRALDTHNAFVEWGLTFGLLGMAAGLCLLAAAWGKARQLDRRDGSVNRRAILLCFGLASMTYVTYYQLFVVAAGGLMLAMLSEAPAAVPGGGTIPGRNMAGPAGLLLLPPYRRRRTAVTV